MIEDPSRLKISEKQLNNVGMELEKIIHSEDALIMHARRGFLTMSKQQRYIHRLLSESGESMQLTHPLFYALGAVSTYKMLPYRLRHKVIKQDELDKIQDHVIEKSLKLMKTPETLFNISFGGFGLSLESVSTTQRLNFDWYMDLLDKSDSTHADWLTYMVSGLEDKHVKSDFFMGSVLVSLPFYLRDQVAAA